jgi:hypothetical protein
MLRRRGVSPLDKTIVMSVRVAQAAEPRPVPGCA